MAFVYINGYPAVGKLTVAKELTKLIPSSKVVDNHSLIDPVARKYERWMPQYYPMRKEVREQALNEAIASAPDITYIFTDSQSSNGIGSATSHEFHSSAKKRGCPFISIILSCQLEENARRLQAQGRGGSSNTKLTDLGIFRTVRETEDIFHFGGPMELELDVTESPAKVTAEKIYAFIRECLALEENSKIS
ncbi:hypothetical protein BDR22DRAFT_34727 [Usnea florida]